LICGAGTSASTASGSKVDSLDDGDNFRPQVILNELVEDMAAALG
jgi:hypothetical protein